jgi:hypothetical protein
MRTVRFTGAALIALVLATAGCTTYYRVTDPNSGRVYYTEEVKRSAQGSVQFRDAKSGADVTPASLGGARDLERRLPEEHG